MKKKIVIYQHGQRKEREVNYIPGRFIFAMFLIVLETLAVLAAVILCAIYIPYFYLAMYATQILCILRIINSPENPDYKVPWLLFVVSVPVAGFMIYFMFYDRKLKRKYIKRIEKISGQQVHTKDEATFEKLEKEDKQAYLSAKLLCKLASTHLYQNTDMQYFDMGEKMHKAILED